MAVILSAVAIACAFLMGYAVNQGSSCAVTAAKQLVHERNGTMLTGLAVAIGIAGLICLPLAWVTGGGTHLAGDYVITRTLVAGAMLLGLGAVINDACLFGTLARIGKGELRFLALPVGLAIGFALSDRQQALQVSVAVPNPLAHPSTGGRSQSWRSPS